MVNQTENRKVVAVSAGTIFSAYTPTSAESFTSTTHLIKNTIFDPYEALSSISGRATFTAPLSRFYQIFLHTPYSETSLQAGTSNSEVDTFGFGARVFNHKGRLSIDGTTITNPTSIGGVYGGGELTLDFSIITGTLSIIENSQNTGFGLTKALLFLEAGQTVTFDVTGRYNGLSRTNVSRIVGAPALPVNNYGDINGTLTAGGVSDISSFNLWTTYSETSGSTIVLTAGGFVSGIEYYFEISEV